MFAACGRCSKGKWYLLRWSQLNPWPRDPSLAALVWGTQAFHQV